MLVEACGELRHLGLEGGGDSLLLLELGLEGGTAGTIRDGRAHAGIQPHFGAEGSDSLNAYSSPAYPGVTLGPADGIAMLRTLLENHVDTHQFWPDSVSLSDRVLFRPGMIRGHRQVTDVYLLGLCQQNGGTLATLDGGITADAIASPHADLIRLINH